MQSKRNGSPSKWSRMAQGTIATLSATPLEHKNAIAPKS